MVNGTVPLALSKLGYDAPQIEKITEFADLWKRYVL